MEITIEFYVLGSFMKLFSNILKSFACVLEIFLISCEALLDKVKFIFQAPCEPLPNGLLQVLQSMTIRLQEQQKLQFQQICLHFQRP